MAQIKLMILDDDDEYSSILCNSLTHSYPDTFLVTYCSNTCSFEEWIKKIEPDIVLTGEGLYSEISPHYQKNIIILTSGISKSCVTSLPTIFKYSDVKKIAGEIINIYTRDGNIIVNTKEKASKVVSVHSASGAVGKTSVAVGVCTICSMSGLSVFYLNLEQFQSTEFLFTKNNDNSISDLIYYVKEKDKNLISRLFTMRSQDSATNIFYFNQANNSFELNELVPQDIEFLLTNLKASGLYDLIVVDMDSRLDSNTIKVFESSDEILFIITDEEICLHKSKQFIESIQKYDNSSYPNSYLSHKVKYVANKVSSQDLPLSTKTLSEISVLSKIPFLQNNTSKKFFFMGGPEIVNSPFKEIAGRYML